MTITSAVGVVSAAALALASVIFCFASVMSLGATDPQERKDATISALWSLILLALCAAAILTLTGCQAAKTVIDTCRDGLCR